MIKIRLARQGAKKAPFYRIVAIEKSRKRNGMPLDVVGYWRPSNNEFNLDKKKFDEWIAKGAQTSKAVEELIETNGNPKNKKAKPKAKDTEKKNTDQEKAEKGAKENKKEEQ